MAAIQPLKSLVVNPRSKHTATVIFVHVSPQAAEVTDYSSQTDMNLQGLGDSGHGWKPVAGMRLYTLLLFLI